MMVESRPMKPQMAGYIFAVLTALFTAAIYILTPEVRHEISAFSIIVITQPIALVVLTIPLAHDRRLRDKLRSTSAAGWGWIVCIAVLTGVGYYLYYTAIPLIDTTVASFLHRSETLVTIVFGVLLLGERLRAGELTGGFLVLGGVVVMKYVGGISIDSGFFLIMASSLAWGILEGLAKIAVRRVDPFIFTWGRSLVLTIGSLAAAAAAGTTIDCPGSTKVALCLVGLALAGPVFARYFYMEALKRLPVSHVALVSQCLPVFVAALSLVLYHTLPTPKELSGGLLIVLGCLLLVAFRNGGSRGRGKPA